jgi:hypothetical protein
LTSRSPYCDCGERSGRQGNFVRIFARKEDRVIKLILFRVRYRTARQWQVSDDVKVQDVIAIHKHDLTAFASVEFHRDLIEYFGNIRIPLPTQARRVDLSLLGLNSEVEDVLRWQRGSQAAERAAVGLPRLTDPLKYF